MNNPLSQFRAAWSGGANANCLDVKPKILKAEGPGKHKALDNLSARCVRCGGVYMVCDGGWLCAACAAEVANGR